jgi:hypothetical protein
MRMVPCLHHYLNWCQSFGVLISLTTSPTLCEFSRGQGTEEASAFRSERKKGNDMHMMERDRTKRDETMGVGYEYEHTTKKNKMGGRVRQAGEIVRSKKGLLG